MRADDEASGRSVGGRDVTDWPTPAGRRLVAAHRRAARAVGSRVALLGGLGLAAAVAVAATWATTALYDAVADGRALRVVDRPVLHAAMRLRSPALDTAAAVIARVAGPIGMPVLALAGAGALSVRRASPSPLVTLAAAGTGSLAMTLGGKGVVQRHRPPLRDAIPPYEHSPSFPSGHTLNATVVVGVLAYDLVLQQRSLAAQAGTGAGAAAAIVGIGLSRVLLGAHWFTDVLCGWSLGAGWLAVVVTADRLRRTDLRHPPADGGALHP